MTRIAVITQARTTSTRLPRKVLAPLGGTTLLELHLERLLASGFDVLVATTTNLSDDEIVSIAHAGGLGVHRGSEDDVLARFDGCVRAFDVDVVVRVTSDCPLVDPSLIIDGVEKFLAADNPRMYLSNALHRTYPRGFDFEVFAAPALHEAAAMATSPAQREHVTPYLYAGETPMVLRNLACPVDNADLRVTVDTVEDLQLVRRLVEAHDAAALDWRGIVEVLRSHPDLVALNAHVAQTQMDDDSARVDTH